MEPVPNQLMTVPLSPERQERRDHLEKEVIPQAIAMYSIGGHALINSLGEIRDKTLYESTHSDFYAYCQDTWNIRRETIRRIIRHYEVIRELQVEPEQITRAALDRLAKLPAPVKQEAQQRVRRQIEGRGQRATRAGRPTRALSAVDVDATVLSIGDIVDSRQPHAPPLESSPNPPSAVSAVVQAIEKEPRAKPDEIPLAVRRDLARGPEFDELSRTLRSVHSKVHELSKQRVGAYLLLGPILSDIDSAISQIAYAKPEQVCDICGGLHETCKKCRSVGWLSRGARRAIDKIKRKHGADALKEEAS